MKTHPHARYPLRPLAVAIALSTLCAVPAAFAAPASKPDEPKTHTLFMGADISIEHDHNLYKVKDISGGSFVIEVNKHQVTVPVDKDEVKMKVDFGLKLTETAAQIDKLKGDRAYTPANDPNRKFAHQIPGGSAAAVSGLAANQLYNAQNSLSSANAALAQATDFNRGAAQQAVNQAQSAFNTASSQMNSAVLAEGTDLNNTGYYAMKLQEELDKKLFDAMEITFTVSSDKLLQEPYVVIITSYREKDAKPNSGSTWIYAQALDPIDSHPKRVRVMHGGFPPGFELEKYQVHLYNAGVEVATNVAPKSVALTSEEAFQYVLIDYMGSHKKATLPASPAMGTLPTDLPSRLAAGEYAQTYYVKVSKGGQAIEVFLDESCAQQTNDPYLVSVMKALRFKPALQKGQPVDSVLPLKLGKLIVSL